MAEMDTNISDNVLSLIEKRFELNISRVRNIIGVYDTLNLFNKRASSKKDDVLRSAVVLLHASLEDVMREAIKWRHPIENDSFAKELSLDSLREEGDTSKFSIRTLRLYKDKSVSDLLSITIEKYLADKSFNNTNQLNGSLEAMELDVTKFKTSMDKLAAMMTRRHKIVHNSDRIDLNSASHGRPRLINKKQVTEWADAVGEFGKLLLAELAPVVAKES